MLDKVIKTFVINLEEQLLEQNSRVLNSIK